MNHFVVWDAVWDGSVFSVFAVHAYFISKILTRLGEIKRNQRVLRDAINKLSVDRIGCWLAETSAQSDNPDDEEFMPHEHPTV